MWNVAGSGRTVGGLGIYLMLTLAALPVFAQTGSIQGTVMAEDGTPIAGAFVGAYRTDMVPNTSSQVTSTSTGAFNIPNLPGGTYMLCVQVPGGGFLDPCHWSLKQTTVTLAAGQASTGNALRIKKGSILKVRLNDPNRLLQPVVGPALYVAMGVWSPTTPFYGVALKSRDALGADYQVTIPLNFPVRFSLFSKQVVLADTGGKAITAAGFAEVVQHNTGELAPKSYTFAVTGLAP